MPKMIMFCCYQCGEMIVLIFKFTGNLTLQSEYLCETLRNSTTRQWSDMSGLTFIFCKLSGRISTCLFLKGDPDLLNKTLTSPASRLSWRRYSFYTKFYPLFQPPRVRFLVKKIRPMFLPRSLTISIPHLI